MAEKNIIINVGRQIGSGGRVVANSLAVRFGCSFYDREILNIAAKESGFSEKFFEQHDESKGFFKSRFHIGLPFIGSDSYYGNDFSQEGLFKFQSDAIRKAAQRGSCVFVGRCADYVLRDFANVVNVFVTADLADRARVVAERYGFTTDEARRYIESGEQKRASYYNYYTGKRWGHGESYDLCVNTSRLGLDATAGFIEEFVRKTLAL